VRPRRGHTSHAGASTGAAPGDHAAEGRGRAHWGQGSHAGGGGVLHGERRRGPGPRGACQGATGRECVGGRTRARQGAAREEEEGEGEGEGKRER
jgi:hypothetical protein